VKIRNPRALAVGLAMLGVATGLAIDGRWEVVGAWVSLALGWGHLATKAPRAFDYKDPDAYRSVSLLDRWRRR
jgi:hypothetical protein